MIPILDSNVALNIPDSWQAFVAFGGAVLALCVTVWGIGLRICKAVRQEVKKTVTEGVAAAFETHRGEHEAMVSVLSEIAPDKTKAAGLSGRPWDGQKPERLHSPGA